MFFHRPSHRKTKNPLRAARYVLEALEPRMMLSAVLWTGAGHDNLWSDKANWSTGAVPGAAADVTLSASATVTATAPVTIDHLQVQAKASLSVQGGMTIANGLANYGTISLGAQEGANLQVTSGTLLNAAGAQIGCAQGLGVEPYHVYLTANVDNLGTITAGVTGLYINIVNTGAGPRDTPTGNTFVNTGTIDLNQWGDVAIAGIARPDDLGTFRGYGTVLVESANWNLSSPWTVPLGVNFGFEDSTFSGGGTLTNSGEFYLVNSTVNSPFANQGSIVCLNNCTINGQMTSSHGSTIDVSIPGVGTYYVLLVSTLGATNLHITKGFTNHGGIDLGSNDFGCDGALDVTNGSLVNAADGTIGCMGGGGSLNAVLDNQGTLNVSGNLVINQGTGTSAYTLTNEAHATIDVASGTLTIGGAAVTNDGLIKMADAATIDFAVPTVTIDGQGTLQGQPTSTVDLRGSLLGNSTNVANFQQPGLFLLDGNGTASSPQLLELMESDQGNVSAAYTNPLAYATLELDAGTYVQLVDQSPNSAGNGAEAGYANTLIVPTSSTFDKNGLNFYAVNTPPMTTAAVTGVSSTQATGVYVAGAVIPITVTFNEPVIVSGTPQLTLNDGAVANYTSGSGTATLAFTYTVKAGDNASDLDYASTAALTGVIADGTADLTLPATGTDGLAAKKIIIDTAPPTPNPSTWAVAPHATSATTISMTATTASDQRGVQYFFHCLTTGGHDSGWQTSPTYQDTRLVSNTAYAYEVMTRDNALNQGNYSTVQAATTLGDTTPPTPNPSTWALFPHATGSTSISMAANTASDPSGVQYDFNCLTAGGHSSSWQASPSYQDTGLLPGHTYTYEVRTRDKSPNQNTGNYSSEQSATTTRSFMSLMALVAAASKNSLGIGAGAVANANPAALPTAVASPISAATPTASAIDTALAQFNASAAPVASSSNTANTPPAAAKTSAVKTAVDQAIRELTVPLDDGGPKI